MDDILKRSYSSWLEMDKKILLWEKMQQRVRKLNYSNSVLLVTKKSGRREVFIKGIKALYVDPGLFKVEKLYWNNLGLITFYPDYGFNTPTGLSH